VRGKDRPIADSFDQLHLPVARGCAAAVAYLSMYISLACDDPLGLGSGLPPCLSKILVATVASGRAIRRSRSTSNDELDLLGLGELGTKQVRCAPPSSRNRIDILPRNPFERPSGHRAWRGGSEQRLDSDEDSCSRGRKCREAEDPATGDRGGAGE
jgi:hypothetical protein